MKGPLVKWVDENIMSEQEYKEKIAVREQLSQFDRLRVLEHEFLQTVEWFRVNALPSSWPEFMNVRGLKPPEK